MAGPVEEVRGAHGSDALMAGFAERAGKVLSDPWSLVLTAIGAGAAWAIGLPVLGIAAVGAGMMGAAALVGGALGRDAGGPAPIELTRGTSQAALVNELEAYRSDLRDLQDSALPAALHTAASDAVIAADNAAATAWKVASAVDGIDNALGRASSVARRMPGSREVRDSVERMAYRRTELLGKLTSAVTGIGEVYTRLLEVSSTAAMAGMGTDGLDEVNRVNESLEALRGAFAELEHDAAATRDFL